MPGQETVATVSIIIAVLAVSHAIDLWLKLRDLQTRIPDPSPRGDGISSRPISRHRRAPIMKAEIKKIYGHKLHSAISKYEIALAEYQDAITAAERATEEAERLERLGSGMCSNLHDAEKQVRFCLKDEGVDTVVAPSGRVYSEAIFSTDEPYPPVAVLLE